MIFQAKWITAPQMDSREVPAFHKQFVMDKQVTKATLYITALGVYEAFINDKRVGQYILAPGWTVYDKRLQYQQYDVTEMLSENNTLCVHVAPGWYTSPLGSNWELMAKNMGKTKALLCALQLTYADGAKELVVSDESWTYSHCAIRFSEIYDGERYDATFVPEEYLPVGIKEHSYDILIPQQGDEVVEQERICGQRIIVTPQGDTLIDFGQEVTGYVEFTVDAHAGQVVKLNHSEVLDKDGNFYNENYRDAKPELMYVCKEGRNTYHPHLTFYGFRQIKIEQWPQPLSEVKPEQFTAIAVYTKLKKTGSLNSSNPMLNQFFSNVFWGQRGNFLDVPTDCPQRNERLGFTGDAQMFCKAASYNFDVLRFFKKWMKDVYLDQQTAGGGVPTISPDIYKNGKACAGWGDAATVIPWQMYQTYGDKEILEDQFSSMVDWVDYITRSTTTPNLWTGCWHYGDWLALDAPSGSYQGTSRTDVIGSAFYAYSTELLVKTGKVLGRDVTKYEFLYGNIVRAFRENYQELTTQTEYVLALQFGLAEDPEKAVAGLVELIRKAGRMETGFVGTPYLLHALSDHGYGELAYELLLREKYPSWLYSVTKGATTVWEHWDGIMENGEFWSKWMNSFNHYAYGAAIDWVYEKAAGIRPAQPGFEKVTVSPLPTDQLDWLEVSLDTKQGTVISKWSHAEGKIRYDITIPAEGDIVIDGVTHSLPAGNYIFWS